MLGHVTDEPLEPNRLAVVTGASGFLGSNLVSRLIANGWRVRTIGRRPSASPPDRVVHFACDVRDSAALVRAFDGAQVVFHLAAKITLATIDPEAWDINVNGPATVARVALETGVPRMVHCSSVHAFDLARSRPLLSERSPRATSADRPLYDRSKAAGEVEVRNVIEAGLDAAIVNPTGILGPGDDTRSRINVIIEQASRGRLPVVVQGGFDWVDVRDVVTGLLGAYEWGRTGENYLLCGHRASALQLTSIAAACGGHRGPVLALPAGLSRRLAPLGERVGRLWHSEAFTPASIGTLLDDPSIDGTKAATELHYRARALEESVRDTVQYFDHLRTEGQSRTH